MEQVSFADGPGPAHRLSEDREDNGGQSKEAGQKRFTNLVQRLFAELPYIKELNMPELPQLLTADMVQYSSCAAGNVLYQEGDPATCCYIVLSGKVQHWKKDTQVSVPFTGNSEGGHMAGKLCTSIASMLSRRAPPVLLQVRRSSTTHRQGTMARRASGMSRRCSHSSDTSAVGNQPAAMAKEDVPIQNFGVIVASNGPATMFGDAELLVPQPRLTTAVACSETCEFLVIEKSDFDTILRSEILRGEIQQVAQPIVQVMMQFPFFQKLDHAVQPFVAEIMHFTYHRRKETIFFQGDAGDLCYIILSGEVGIWVNGLKDALSDNSVRKEYGNQVARSSCATILSCLNKVNSLNRAAANAQEMELANGGGAAEKPGPSANAGQVVQLGPGRMFGELALLEDQPRSATVVCNEDSAFLTIEKADFERVLKQAMNEAVMSLPLLSEPLLNEISFFQSLRPSVRQRVRHMVKYNIKKRGTILFWQGDTPSRCYIVLSGEVSCFHQNTGKTEKSPIKDMGTPYVGEAVYAKCSELASRLAEVNRTPTREEDSRISEEVFEKMGVRRRMARKESITEMLGDESVELSQGSIFGERELLTDERCLVTAVCNKDCQFLYIERSDFERVVKEDLMRMKVQELNMQVRRLLHGYPLFQDLAPSVQETVPEIVHYSHHPRGTVLFREGDAPDCCYIVLSGEVTIFKKRATAHATGEDAGLQKWPPLAQPNPESYERCVQLAAKLEPVSSCLRHRPDLQQNARSSIRPCPNSQAFIADGLLRNGDIPVKSLGPGFLFGELGLLSNIPRNATVYCKKDSEFLQIENCDFDRVLKRELAKVKDEKLEFLRTYVPGMRSLPERMAEGLLHHFDKKTVPLKHVFMEQGEVADGSMYFVWRGSVEFYTHSGKRPEGFSLLPDNSFRRLRVLIKGGVFGAVPIDMRLPFTAVARSAPCEVLHVTMQHMKQLPESVMRGLRKLMDQTLVWASENCSPILTAAERPSPAGAPRETSPPGLGTSRSGSTLRPPGHVNIMSSLPSLTRVPRLQSSKIPRPLSFKIPRPLDGLSSGHSPSHGSDKLQQLVSSTPTWGGGLFQRNQVDGELSSSPKSLCSTPAEGKPLVFKSNEQSRKKDTILQNGLHMSSTTSLPAMRSSPSLGQ